MTVSDGWSFHLEATWTDNSVTKYSDLLFPTFPNFVVPINWFSIKLSFPVSSAMYILQNSMDFCVLFLPDMAVVVNSLSQAIKSLGFPDTRFFRLLSYFHYWIFFISSSGSTSCNAYLYVGMPHSICIGWKHKYLNEQVNK